MESTLTSSKNEQKWFDEDDNEIKINLIQSDADMDDIVSEYITIISNIIFK